MALRALRAATTVDGDTSKDIESRTVEMVKALMDRNQLSADDLISILFSVTSDITALAPAAAVRSLGIVDVPLLCVREMELEDSPNLCIRMLVHIETDKDRSSMRHTYLHGAAVLRPDLVTEMEDPNEEVSP